MLIVLAHGMAALGGTWLARLKIPAGGLLGAILAVALLTVGFNNAVSYPAELRVLVQILSGVAIGSKFTKEDLRSLRVMMMPVLVLVSLIFVINIGFAYIISATSSLSLMTAMFASAPGGVSDLALIAVDFGADPQQVTVLQLVRFVTVVTVCPFIMRSLKVQPSNEPVAVKQKIEYSRLHMLIYIAAAIAGGIVFRALNIPAGAIIGAMAAVVILNMAAFQVFVPAWLKTAIQICAGCYIGCQITRQTLSMLPQLLVPALWLILELALMSGGIAWTLHKLCNMDLVTALFSCTPGGIAEMGLIAEETGADLPKIMLMHTCRLIAVICVLPLLATVF